MQASAKELQAIIDEAWKNPEFQEASKTKQIIETTRLRDLGVFSSSKSKRPILS